MAIVRKTMEEIAADAADEAGLTVDEWRAAIAAAAKAAQKAFEQEEEKRMVVSLRLSPKTLSAFRASGPGHTSRMAAVLDAVAAEMSPVPEDQDASR